MQFCELALYLDRLEAIASRNAMTEALAEVLSRAGAGEVDRVCYLLLGELLPAYHGVELNVAEKLMIQVLAKAYGRSPAEIERRYKAKGDLGDVAQALATRSPKGSGSSSAAVYDRLLAVAGEVGAGSQARKVSSLAELISRLDARSAKFVTRILVGKLRLGFSEATLLDALSFMARGDKSARSSIERAYNVAADVGAIARRIKRSGLAALGRIRPKPGLPIRSSLAERAQSVEEAMVKAGPRVGVEPKLDGFRTQVHVWTAGGAKRTALFSRNLENTTAMFPEIAAAARALAVKSVILDGEAIGYTPATGKFLPFQETAQRKRKHGVPELAKKIPLTLFAFDVLYANGRSLLAKPFRQRRARLERLVGGERGAIRLARHRETDDPAVVKAALAENIAAGLEGIVVKKLGAPYDAGKRGFHWLKLKATSAALAHLRSGSRRAEKQVPDTMDCVVMAAYRGRGKRAAFGLGGFLLGVRGADDRYYSISRLGSGLSDEQFREARRRLAALRVPQPPKDYAFDSALAPDVWVRPALVVEILADEITLSLRHTAGRRREGERGYSLRFPRLVRFRDDKNPGDATTVSEIASLYRRQKVGMAKH